MTKKNLGIGILAMALVFGMIVVSCKNDGDDNGGNGTTSDAKSITITEISGLSGSGEVIIWLATENPIDNREEVIVAFGIGNISGTSITFNLMKYNSTLDSTEKWTGSGSYVIAFLPLPKEDDFHLYTNGQELTRAMYDNPPKYNISSSRSTIPFNHFRSLWDFFN